MSQANREKESRDKTKTTSGSGHPPNNIRREVDDVLPGGVIISEDSREKMIPLLRNMITWRTLTMMNSCVNCGMCADACHYYLSTNDPRLIPASKMEKLTRILRKHQGFLTSKVPFLEKSHHLTSQEANDLYRIIFEHCSLCGRCGMACPMGINAGPTFLTARTMFAQIGMMPSGLNEPVQTAVDIGNYVGLSVEDFVDTLEWIAEELAEELEVDDFTIPVDLEGADSLFVPHPLEVRDNPLLITATVKILNSANENYTFSTSHFDTANYAYYSGHTESMIRIVKRLLQAKDLIKAKNVVLSPCGHGYRVMRWEAERNLGYRFPFKVFTFSELIARYIREGRITVKKDLFDGPITYHDPCNLARYGGIIEEPRNILKALSSNFVEMRPSGVWNYCGGGGGGLAATGDFGKTRITAGKVKAEQIAETGAKIVTTNCYNCRTQILELNEKYNLGVKVLSIVELVADSIESYLN